MNNPLNETGDRDPWAKYKWWILAGLALLLAAAAGLLLRKPAGEGAAAAPLNPPQPWPPAPVDRAASSSPTQQGGNLMQALKEELFALETERLQQHISEADYLQARAAFDLILRRTLARANGGRPATATQASLSANPEPALTGSPRA